MGRRIVVDMDKLKEVELDNDLKSIPEAIDRILFTCDGWLGDVVKPLLEDCWDEAEDEILNCDAVSHFGLQSFSEEKEQYISSTLQKLDNNE